jgi:hypothetical protein
MSAAELKRHVFRSPAFQSVVDEAVRFLGRTPIHPLPPEKKFIGSGVYAIYYCGRNEPYRRLARLNQKTLRFPIYVGKAVPPGWRTGRVKLSTSPDLCNRIRKHAQSIAATSNLNVKDFRCRFLILTEVEGDLVVPVEAALIRRFTPLWNSVVGGFGLHDPGSTRYTQILSEWDTLHSGRSWTKKWQGKSSSKSAIAEKIKRHLDKLEAGS